MRLLQEKESVGCVRGQKHAHALVGKALELLGAELGVGIEHRVVERRGEDEPVEMLCRAAGIFDPKNPSVR